MAHFVKLNDKNEVIDVIVVSNYVLVDGQGNEIEENGINFLKSMFGNDTRWKQTSYNGNFRKRFAGIGFTYDPENDIFVPPKPYNSWILNDDFNWISPIAYPENDGGHLHVWNESKQNWEPLAS